MDIKLDVLLRNEIISATHKGMPNEICGVILNNETFLEVQNLHHDPENHFALDPNVWEEEEKGRKITCIVHSHTKGQDTFSPQDVRSCKQLQIPWYLFCLPSGKEIYYDPLKPEPLLGREWHYGLWDCYSLVKDYYSIQRGIRLKDYERGAAMDWMEPEWNVFVENFQEEGFKIINEDKALKSGDVILMQLQGHNPNHLGMILDPNTNVMLHHLYGRLSEVTVYGGYWLKHTKMRLRHESI